MTNIFVEKFKKIVTDYYTEVCSLRAKAGYNTATYNEQVAEDYNAEIESEITERGNQAISAIDRVFTDVKQRIKTMTHIFIFGCYGYWN